MQEKNTNNMNALAVLRSSPEQSLSRYFAEIKQFPMLKPEEEKSLADRWYYDEDRDAAQTLVTSHLRLVAKIAMKYRGYGLPVGDLISEGNIGLMQAVKKFDPRKGFRLATYAMWWIKASIQEYVLKSWSLVKIGTTAAQKKLFFNLKKMKSQMQAYDQNDLSPEQVAEISTTLDVPEYEVLNMNARMGSGGDASLNAPIGGEEGASQWQDQLEDDRITIEDYVEDSEEMRQRRQLMVTAMESLKDRERAIFEKRKLSDPVHTLEDLSQEYGISRERVRQIENRAMEKVAGFIENHADYKQLSYSPTAS